MEEEIVKKSEYINSNIEKLMKDISKVNKESQKIIQTEFEEMFKSKQTEIDSKIEETITKA